MKMAVALAGVLVCLTAVAVGAQTEKTSTLTGTVVEVDGGTLIVKMDNGEIRMFTPPADRVFVIDGKELKLSELKPGTKLNATVKEITTTSTVQTVETLEGTVAYTAGTTVILTLPTNERRQYTIKSTDPVKFYDQNGKEMTVFDLRKNMKIKATKITEAPRVELVQNVAVTGTAPTQAAAAAPAAAAPKPAAAPAAAAAPASQTASTSGADGRDAEDASQDGELSASARPDRSRVAGGGARPHHRTASLADSASSRVALILGWARPGLCSGPRLAPRSTEAGPSRRCDQTGGSYAFTKGRRLEIHA